MLAVVRCPGSGLAGMVWVSGGVRSNDRRHLELTLRDQCNNEASGEGRLV